LSQRNAGAQVETQQSSAKTVREKTDQKAEVHSTALHPVSKPTAASNAAANVSNASNGPQSAKPAVRADKGASSSDRPEKTAATALSDRPKSEGAEKKSSSPKQAPPGGAQSGSLSPSEALRKLFNPHG
jgi:hypothetical protein